MTDKLHIAAIQCNPSVGAVEDNTQLIINKVNSTQKEQPADLIIFPELILCGYPPEDLLYRPGLYQHIENALENICKNTPNDCTIIVGHPAIENQQRYNRVSIIQNQKIITHYDKQALPNYTVFDEKRYFTPGNQPLVIDIKGYKIGILICEDIWVNTPVEETIDAGAKALIVINASPYSINKDKLRRERTAFVARKNKCPILYLNTTGGQDELVFDGRSFCLDAKGQCHQSAPLCKKYTMRCEWQQKNNTIQPTTTAKLAPSQPLAKEIYDVLVTGIHDYVTKNQFPSVILGLSGGVDSALTLSLAVDALGKDRVQAIMMPSRHTAAISLEDARAQALQLGVDYQIIDIEPIYQSFLNSLTPLFQGKPVDATEENLQARCRGTLLMALSNKTGAMVLTTGNKSEMAVGYSTLYGDLAGGFAPLKDVYKTTVYKLCEYRNSINTAIPERVITRAPSAELADDQKDQDTLPPYPALDDIIERFVHLEHTKEMIAQSGYEEPIVDDVIKRIYRNEYKRRQAPIGIRISQHAFGKDRRYPITMKPWT